MRHLLSPQRKQRMVEVSLATGGSWVSLSRRSCDPGSHLGLVNAWFCRQCSACCLASRPVRRGVAGRMPRNLEDDRKGRRSLFASSGWCTGPSGPDNGREKGLICDQLSHREWLFALLNGISYANRITGGQEQRVLVTVSKYVAKLLSLFLQCWWH